MELALAKTRKKIDLFAFQDAISYLKELYTQHKSLQKSYSLTNYSMDLGFGNNNTMAQIHSEHRSLSTKAAARIATQLELTKTEEAYFIALVEMRLAKTQQQKEQKLALILELRGRQSKDQNQQKELEFFNDWHHAVVFELLELENGQSIEEICKKFAMPITEADVRKSIDLLTKLNMAKEIDNTGRFVKTQNDFSAGHAVPGMAIVRFHQEMMNLAKASLLDTPPQQREISSVTIAIDEAMIPRLKEDIRLFRNYLMFLASQSQQTNKVMQVNIQLFPISK